LYNSHRHSPTSSSSTDVLAINPQGRWLMPKRASHENGQAGETLPSGPASPHLATCATDGGRGGSLRCVSRARWPSARGGLAAQRSISTQLRITSSAVIPAQVFTPPLPPAA
jgi:hypothetical protein